MARYVDIDPHRRVRVLHSFATEILPPGPRRKRPTARGSWPGDGSRSRCGAGPPDARRRATGPRLGGRAVPTNVGLRGNSAADVAHGDCLTELER